MTHSLSNSFFEMSFLRRRRKSRFSAGSIFDGVESSDFFPEAFSTASKVPIFRRKHFRRCRKFRFFSGSIFDGVESSNFLPEAFSTASKVPIFLRKHFERRCFIMGIWHTERRYDKMTTDLFNYKSIKKNLWSSVKSVSSVCHFLF